jgi:hypothetical protein
MHRSPQELEARENVPHRRIGRHGLRLVLALSILLATLVPTAPVWAAECTTKDVRVTYTVVYDNISKADIVTGVKAYGLPSDCSGRTLTVVLAKAGVTIRQIPVFIDQPINPAARGSVITFWGTGMGSFETAYEDGAIVGANYAVLRSPIRVSVGGIDGQVLYAGSSPEMVAGVTQVNLRLAPNTRVSSRVPMAITLGDVTSSELAYVSVK